LVVANNTHTSWGESEGGLAEWDGKRWRVLSRKPFMECGGRPNLGGAVFATGWDEASALFWALINGTWRRHRLPKASHTFEQYWQTEWTRIREVETERFLMAGNEGTPNADNNPVGGQPQSGMWFGKPRGWGGVWRGTAVKGGQPSDPFLMTGFGKTVLHLKVDVRANVTIEVDFLGHGAWEKYERIAVGAGEYKHHVFPAGFSAHWVRLVSDAKCTATAEFIYT
jgi:hypothetical protein